MKDKLVENKKNYFTYNIYDLYMWVKNYVNLAENQYQYIEINTVLYIEKEEHFLRTQ